MKKQYTNAQMRIITIAHEDILTDSLNSFSMSKSKTVGNINGYGRSYDDLSTMENENNVIW